MMYQYMHYSIFFVFIDGESVDWLTAKPDVLPGG